MYKQTNEQTNEQTNTFTHSLSTHNHMKQINKRRKVTIIEKRENNDKNDCEKNC
jgi:hypothetical protein